MALSNCDCLLGQYYDAFTDTNSIRTLKDAREALKKKGRRNEVNAFLSTLEPFPASYTTSNGIAGDRLLELGNRIHQRGLVEMAHYYLCVEGNGNAYWPDDSNDRTLKYSRDKNE